VLQVARAGKRVGPASRVADDGELVQAQMVSELGDVTGPIDESSTGVIRAVPIAGPVNGDQTDRARQSGGVVHDELRATTGRTVVRQDGGSRRVPDLDPGEVAPIG